MSSKSGTGQYLNIYLEYRSKKTSLKTDKLIIFENSAVTNGNLNKMFSIFNERKENYNSLNTKVNSQKLVRSGILHSLRETNGSNTFYFISIFGLKKNTQLRNALNEFLILENAHQIY